MKEPSSQLKTELENLNSLRDGARTPPINWSSGKTNVKNLQSLLNEVSEMSNAD